MIPCISCSQQEILASEALCGFLLDTIIENLSHIFGEDMGSPENRQAWIQYNLERSDPDWHVMIGQKNGVNAATDVTETERGFLLLVDAGSTAKIKEKFQKST